MWPSAQAFAAQSVGPQRTRSVSHGHCQLELVSQPGPIPAHRLQKSLPTGPAPRQKTVDTEPAREKRRGLLEWNKVSVA